MRQRSGLIVEHARPADAAAAEALLDAAAAWHQSRGIDQWTPGQFGEEIAQTIADGELFVARRDGETVGCFMLEMQDSARFEQWLEQQGRVDASGANIGRLAVARDMTGRGIGLELMDAARRMAAAAGLEYLRLDCPADNHRLRRYYVDAGFTHCGDVHERGPNGESWVVSLYERAVG